MSKQREGGSMPFERVRARDKSDPGFRLPGKKLRWISAKQTELNMDRPWAVLRRSMLPAELLQSLENANPGISSQGDTIRRGEMTLAYASEEAALHKRKEINTAIAEQKERIGVRPSKQIRVDENETEKVGADLFRNTKES